MNDKQLLAIVAAIIHAGGDDNERLPGYTPEECVQRALAIISAAKLAESEPK